MNAPGHSPGLTDVVQPELENLLRCVERGELECPLDRASLQESGFGHLASSLDVLHGLNSGAVMAVLRVALAERLRPRPEVELVWTGPDARGSASRDTAVVMRQLFEEAQRRILVAGYRFDHGGDILRPVHTALRDRQVEATFVLDLPKAKSIGEVEAFTAREIERFLERNWPFGPPLPTLYYDPRTVEPGPFSNMHAKCVVIDDRVALVGSANFTQAAQTRNIEVGVLVRDQGFAERLASQWIGMAEEGLVRQYVIEQGAR